MGAICQNHGLLVELLEVKGREFGVRVELPHLQVNVILNAFEKSKNLCLCSEQLRIQIGKAPYKMAAKRLNENGDGSVNLLTQPTHQIQ